MVKETSVDAKLVNRPSNDDGSLVLEPSAVVPDANGRVTRITAFEDVHLIENTCV